MGIYVGFFTIPPATGSAHRCFQYRRPMQTMPTTATPRLLLSPHVSAKLRPRDGMEGQSHGIRVSRCRISSDQASPRFRLPSLNYSCKLWVSIFEFHVKRVQINSKSCPHLYFACRLYRHYFSLFRSFCCLFSPCFILGSAITV